MRTHVPARLQARASPYLCPLLLALAAGPSFAAPSAQANVCMSAADEAAVHKRESDLLGRLHAEQHRAARRHQCEAQRGLRRIPAQGQVTPAARTLTDDALVREAAIVQATGSRKLVDAAAKKAADTASTLGRWSDPFVIPVVGVTAVLLHTGKVMFWSYDPVDYHNPQNSRNGVAYIWDPVTRTGRNIAPPENIWCAGQTILSDGRVYVSGGNLRYPDPNAPAGTGGWAGPVTNYTFNPIAETWARQPDMVRGRWYPTTTRLADNRVVITSGIDETGSNAITNQVELFTPDPHMDGIGTMQVVSVHNPTGLYPLQFVLSSGSMLEAGPAPATSNLLQPNTWTWTTTPPMSASRHYLANGVVYTDETVKPSRQVVMVAGGHDETQPIAANQWMDGHNPMAGWKNYPLWNKPRHNANTVILPDGALFTVGGNAGLYGYENPIFDTELYTKRADDTTGTWMPAARHAVQAAYHSTAILLPDATVLLSQDDMDPSAAAAFQHKAQVYSPPYLFRGPQPKITAAPAQVAYGQSFSITTDRAAVSAMLVAPGATTHGNDMHQRAVRLEVQSTGTATLAAKVPASSAVAPPGYYMLFVTDALGIPSVARWVRVT